MELEAKPPYRIEQRELWRDFMGYGFRVTLSSLMYFAIKSIFLKILHSFWFVPTALACIAVVGAAGINALDHAIKLDQE
ncbi:MAG: hypothetical protein ACQKBV_07635, partial [Puniceicoccales bacterium]